MALTSTSKQISSLKINKVPSEAIYAKMVAQNLINDDELYYKKYWFSYKRRNIKET